ncbi:MAG TPA: hypothetical protein VGH23_07205 [Rhizomicrobium sp.]|jgi:hypothetical protein
MSLPLAAIALLAVLLGRLFFAEPLPLPWIILALVIAPGALCLE